MKKVGPERTVCAIMVILASLAACQVGDWEDLEPRVGPRPEGDDIGSRGHASEASQRRGLCPTGVGCSTADVNRDGKKDLVRIDAFGMFGAPGTVEVAYSNGWDFGPMRAVAEGVCIGDSGCLVADVDGDGIPDLVQFIRDGVANPVEVFLGVPPTLDDDLLFLAATPWAEGLCALGQHCNAADVTGDGKADLVAFTGDQDGQVLVSVSDGAQGLVPSAWAFGLCAGDGARCHLGDANADGRADVIELDGAAGSARVALALPTGGFGPPQWWADDITCPPEGTCQVGDFDGDFDVDVLAMYPESFGIDPLSCSGSCGGPSAGGCWCDDLCAQYGDCCADHQAVCVTGSTCEGNCGGAGAGCWCDDLCTDYGDCCADHQPWCDPLEPIGRVRVWPSMGDHFGAVIDLQNPGCEPGQRCWADDVTGDGRVDLISVDAAGTLALWPSEDVLDELDRDALRLTLLRADWERRRAEQERRMLDELLLAVAPVPPEWLVLPHFAAMVPSPPPAPSPSDPAPPFDPLPQLEPWPGYAPGAIDRAWFDTQIADREADIEAGINAVLAALPGESDLLWTADQLRWQAALGKVIAARTSLHAPALGVSLPSHGGQCHNAVVHDRISEDGTSRHEGSYVSRYYDALRVADLDDRLWASLPALTGIVEGMRCLSQRELAALEEAFVRAVLTTMQDLLARGHAPMAQIVWDQALPIELLLFDGVKTYSMPKGWQMLQVRIESGALVIPDPPALGSDFDAFIAEDSTTCSTVRCGLYKSPARATASGQNLTLDTLGVWLPDLLARDRLRRSALDPQVLLDAMVNLEVLGEGDCPLIELTFYNLSCKSRRTCELSGDLATANALGLQVGPGGLGSPYTHFGTNRSDLGEANGCGESPAGGAAPSTCMGPELRGRQGRLFPLDPELDAVMSCTLETFDGETPTVADVAADLAFDPSCLMRDDPKTDPPQLTNQRIDDGMYVVKDLLEGNDGSGGLTGVDREQMIALLMAKTGATHDEVVSAMAFVAEEAFGAASPQLRHLGGAAHSAATAHYDEYGQFHLTWSLDPAEMDADLETLTDGMGALEANATAEEFVATVLLHEAIHMVVFTLESRGQTEVVEFDIQHEVTDALGLGRSCDPSSGGCSGSCGYVDARMARFSECLAGGEPAPFDRCVISEDYCHDRRNGNLVYGTGLGCDAPDLPPLPPLCMAVTCGDGSDLASECCGGPAGGSGSPPYGPTSPGPGPYPGDPDGSLPPVPGGLGGVPMPPIPIPSPTF